ncbi:MAG: hypothetical protein AAB352_00205 [Patescibacteria group bacterium]
MITERQEKLLNFLIKEYITTAEPVSSMALKKVIDLDVCCATIRNDLQVLAKDGFIEQPHTSAGRVPTKKAYKYFVWLSQISRSETDKIIAEQQREFDNFIEKQIKQAHQEMEQEIKFMEELMETLENDNLFEILNILDIWHKKTMM